MEALIEHPLELAGSRTRGLELPGDGPGLVLLHGWGDSADTWRPLLAALGRTGRRALAVDLPGFGSASGLDPGAILPQLDDFAAALVQEWAGGEPVVVAGSSLGGCVALRLAERAGELPLTGVVPVSTSGLELPAWSDAVERDPIIRRLLDIPIPVPTALVHRLVGGEALAIPRAPQPGALAQTPFDLKAIGCPVMLVWGTRDRAQPHGGARVALEALPATRVELIDGCGRCPQLEATGRLLELLLAFPLG